MERLLSYIFVLIVIGCTNGSQTESNESVIPQAAVELLKKNVSEEQGAQMSDFAKMRENYIDGYTNIKVIDTLEIIGNDSIHIRLEHKCLFDSLIVLTKDYLWEGGLASFTSHNFQATITLSNGRETDTVVIGKNEFISRLSEELIKYGVLQFPTYRGYDQESSCLRFGFSISIPVTDIGVGVGCALEVSTYKLHVE